MLFPCQGILADNQISREELPLVESLTQGDNSAVTLTHYGIHSLHVVLGVGVGILMPVIIAPLTDIVTVEEYTAHGHRVPYNAICSVDIRLPVHLRIRHRWCQPVTVLEVVAFYVLGYSSIHPHRWLTSALACTPLLSFSQGS